MRAGFGTPDETPEVTLAPEAAERLYAITSVAGLAHKARAWDVIAMADWVLTGDGGTDGVCAGSDDGEATDAVMAGLAEMLAANDAEPGVLKSATDLMKIDNGDLIENREGQYAMRVRDDDPFCFQIINPAPEQPIKAVTAGELMGYMPPPYRIVPGSTVRGETV